MSHDPPPGPKHGRDDASSAGESHEHSAHGHRHEHGHEHSLAHSHHGHSHSHHGHSHAPGHSHGHSHEHPHAQSHEHLGQENALVYAHERAAHAGEIAEKTPRSGLLGDGIDGDKILFLDCPSGAAGDMIIAALLDLGMPLSIVTRAVEAVGFEGARVSAKKVTVGALSATHFEVDSADQTERSYRDIKDLLEASSLAAPVRDLALEIFEVLGRAEAQVHGVPLDQVHFHEVGAVDSIIDIVGAAALLTELGARVVTSPLPMGRGYVTSRHGPIPLPAPATLLCLAGVPTYPDPLQSELVTPTGAAILKAVSAEFLPWPHFTPQTVGYGAGTRVLPDRPNAVRAVLGSASEKRGALERDVAILVETNIDDQTPEVLGYLLDELLREGALDAWVTPIVMKKSRPAFLLSVLGPAAQADALVEIILRQSSTLGVRRTKVERTMLKRRIVQLASEWGPVRFKVSGEPPLSAKPELEDAVRIAEREGIALRMVLLKLTALGASLLGE